MWRSRIGPVAYWSLALVLTAFGFIDLVAIGAPFLLTGVALLLVGPWRRDRAILLPVLVGIWAFVVGYVLLAPIECRTSAGMDPITECSYLLGLIHSYGARPSLGPTLLLALVASAGGAVVTRRALRRRAPMSYAPRS